MESDAALVWLIGIVGFVIVTIAVTGAAKRVGWSAPVALVAVGAIVSLIPGVPHIELAPEIVLFVILPPLLFAAALQASLIDIRQRRDSILLLSVGLVVFTVVIVGGTAWLVIPGITLAAAAALGAIVAPTDYVAVAAVTQRVRLPRRVQTIVEGEGLLNDATSLVALSTAILAITGEVTPFQVGADFVLAVVVGGGLGAGVGFLIATVRSRLRSPVLDTSLSLVTPYIAFVPAELLHGSGILAVVVAGLWLGWRAPYIQSAESRVAESINWRTIEFLLNNAVFLFIGLNLAAVIEGAADSGFHWWQIIAIAASILAAVVVSRFVWSAVVTLVYRFGPQRLRQRSWAFAQTVPITLAGMRGVVTLAAAFLLPPETPNREFLQVLAFVVVVGTLLIGLALPWTVRALKLPLPNPAQERTEARMLLAEAERAGLESLDTQVVEQADRRVIERLETETRFLGSVIDADADGTSVEPVTRAYGHLRLTTLAAERRAVLAARKEGRYQEAAVRTVLRILDSQETALRKGAAGDDPATPARAPRRRRAE